MTSATSVGSWRMMRSSWMRMMWSQLGVGLWPSSKVVWKQSWKTSWTPLQRDLGFLKIHLCYASKLSPREVASRSLGPIFYQLMLLIIPLSMQGCNCSPWLWGISGAMVCFVAHFHLWILTPLQVCLSCGCCCQVAWKQQANFFLIL